MPGGAIIMLKKRLTRFSFPVASELYQAKASIGPRVPIAHPALAAVVGMALVCLGSVSHADVIHYNIPGDFTDNFAENPAGASRYVETDGIGVGGSRALDVLSYGPNDGGVVTAVYTSESFDLSSLGSQLYLSQFVRTRSYNTGLTTLQLGIMGTSDQNLTDTTARYLSVSFNRFYSRLEVTNKASDSAPTTSNFTTGGSITTGNWYELSLNLTNLGSGGFSLSATFDDYGTTGTTTPLRLITLPSTSFSNPDLASDASLYAVFRGHLAGGADAYDNFSVQVPEPTSGVLVALAIFVASMRFGWRTPGKRAG